MTTWRLSTNDPDLVSFMTSPNGLTARLGRPVAHDTCAGAIITDLDALRTLGEHEDGCVTDDEEGPVVWVEGEPYRLTPT